MRFAVHPLRLLRAWAKSRSAWLLYHLAARAQPGMLGAGGGGLAALLKVARRAGAAGPPAGLLLDREVLARPGVPQWSRSTASWAGEESGRYLDTEHASECN